MIKTKQQHELKKRIHYVLYEEKIKRLQKIFHFHLFITNVSYLCGFIVNNM